MWMARIIHKGRLKVLAFLVIAVFGVWDGVALAYLDPGSGSYFTQVLVAALLAVACSFKGIGTRLKQWWSKVLSRKNRTRESPQN